MRSEKELKLQLQKAVKSLRSGGLVIYPTETAYALGCDARRAAAVQAIYHLKKRSGRKTLPCIAASTAMVRRFFVLTGTAEKLSRQHWPGPLTLVLPVGDKRIQKALRSKTVAIRVSSHPVACLLSRRLGAPIVSTSANPSRKGNFYTIEKVLHYFGGRTNIKIIDAGRLPPRKSSTIIAFKNNKPVVLRQGQIRIARA